LGKVEKKEMINGGIQMNNQGWCLDVAVVGKTINQCSAEWWLVATYEGLHCYEGWHQKSLKKVEKKEMIKGGIL